MSSSRDFPRGGSRAHRRLPYCGSGIFCLAVEKYASNIGSRALVANEPRFSRSELPGPRGSSLTQHAAGISLRTFPLGGRHTVARVRVYGPAYARARASETHVIRLGSNGCVTRPRIQRNTGRHVREGRVDGQTGERTNGRTDGRTDEWETVTPNCPSLRRGQVR